MADQKSRGGQKEEHEKQPQGKQNRDTHASSNPGQHGGRDMAEDAARGQQDRQGGYGPATNQDDHKD